MPHPLVTHKITPEARRLLRQIAATTNEKQYVALERVLQKEWQRLSNDRHTTKGR